MSRELEIQFFRFQVKQADITVTSTGQLCVVDQNDAHNFALLRMFECFDALVLDDVPK